MSTYFANDEVCVFVSGDWHKGRVLAVFGDSYRVEYNAAGVLVTEDNVSNSRLFPCARMQTVINLASPSKSSSGRSQLSNVKSRNLSAELQSVSRERVKSQDLSVSKPASVVSNIQQAATTFRGSVPGQPRYAEMFLSLQQEVLTLRQKLDALTNGPMLAQESNLDLPFDWEAFDNISEQSFQSNIFD